MNNSGTIFYKNVMIQIFQDHWERFKEFHPGFVTDDVEENVEKMMGCGMVRNGYFEYWCTVTGCGARKKIAFTCKSRFCLRCSRIYVEKWMDRMRETVFSQVSHRHVVLTVPGGLWKYFHSKEMLKVLADCGRQLLEDMVGCFKPSRPLKIGMIVVIQTAGRAGRWNPHLHILVTEGGIGEDGQWYDVTYIDWEVLKRKWMYYLFKGIREALQGDGEVEAIIDEIYRKRRYKGLIARAKKEKVRKRDIVGYLIKYVASPPIALSRVISYDGENVRYWYREHPTDRKVEVEVSAFQFIAWLVEQIAPKQFKMVRHYGLYGRRIVRQMKVFIDDLFAGAKEVVQEFRGLFGYVGGRLSYRERMIKSFGKDPLKCPKCGEEMELWYIWHPRYGYIYDFARDAPGVVEEVKESGYAMEKEEADRQQRQLSFWGQDYQTCLC